MRFHVKNRNIRLIEVDLEGVADVRDPRHVVLKLTLKNGEKYALDMTGAQYGWTDTITSWNSYEASRIRSITDEWKFGQTLIDLEQQVQSRDASKMLAHIINSSFMDIMNNAIENYSTQWLQGMTIRIMLGLPEEDFRASRSQFIQELRGGLERFRALSERLDLWKTSGPFKGDINQKLLDAMISGRHADLGY